MILAPWYPVFGFIPLLESIFAQHCIGFCICYIVHYDKALLLISCHAEMHVFDQI